MTEKKRAGILFIILSYIVFVAGWCARAKFIDLSSLGELGSWGVGFVIYILWWPVLAMVIISRFKMNISLSKMLKTKPDVRMLIILSAFALVYNICGYLINRSGFGNNMKTYDLIATVLCVGFFEEIVFRGWFMNAISTHTTEKKANLISSVLFVLVHFPGWIMHGRTAVSMLCGSVVVYLLSLVFGYVFRKSRSVWTGAIFHSIWDMITFLL